MHQGNFTVKRLHMYLRYIRIQNGQMNTTSTHTSLCFYRGTNLNIDQIHIRIIYMNGIYLLQKNLRIRGTYTATHSQYREVTIKAKNSYRIPCINVDM